MRYLVTGSAGHLGEAIVRTLRQMGRPVSGLDLVNSVYTDFVGSITEPAFVQESVCGTDYVIHTATLHKPHLATHSRQDFVEVNVGGTLNVLEAALAAGVKAVVFTSTTSVFAGALTPDQREPTVWVTEDLKPIPKNIYGVTKEAAEALCELFFRSNGLPCIVLRTSRFFPEVDDNEAMRKQYDDLNLKVNEYLYRRVDLADVVDAHLLAVDRAEQLGFRRFIVSATSPFTREHLTRLHSHAPEVVNELFPEYVAEYERRGWQMLPGIDRVYVNQRAQDELGWAPKYNYRKVIECLQRNEGVFSSLAREVGSKGYHQEQFPDGFGQSFCQN